jgi:putrescine transport system substrate-binding protein
MVNRHGLWALVFIIVTAFGAPSYARELNIYSWSNAIHSRLIEEFTAETGIKVNVDPYESGDLMEVKMLTGDSGYDLVFVTASPYLDRQAKLGVYQPLDRSKLKNYDLLSSDILRNLAVADPGNKYSIPFVWGSTGFGVNKTRVLSLLPDAPLDSFAMFFDPEIVSKVSPCGVVLIDSPIEVFPAVLSYLGLDPNSSNLDDLQKATEVLMKIKPYISKFQPVVTPRELVSGEACVVQGWSGDVVHAENIIARSGSKEVVAYYIAKEGGFIWIDTMAIPADAPNPELAYKFIDFILRPENIAQVTNKFMAANAVPDSRPYLDQGVRDNKSIYPPLATIERLDVDVIHSPQYERRRFREWTRVKTGR